MRYYLNQLKLVLSKIELKEVVIIIFIALFVNHLTQPEYFPLDPAYQFPLLPIGFTFIVGLLLRIVTTLNFQRYKKQYFSKQITLKNLFLFVGATQGLIGVFYLLSYLIYNYINEEELALYDFIVGVSLTLLLCSIYLFFIFSKPIYDLHKWAILDGKLTIKRGEKTTLLNYADIAYFYSLDKTVYVVKIDGTKLSTDFTLSQLETILADPTFFRVNRKIIVHFQAVAKVTVIENGKLIILLSPDFGDKNADSIIISRYKKQAFQDWLQKKLK